ncbi:MAG: non-hydrolyzing UDP-N-acetylglucosamine 2-epimerase [Planctomycetota bacterium]
MTIVAVVGARPQFIKAAAVSRAIDSYNRDGAGARISEKIVHTGQHYDDNMSRIFFQELRIPSPAINLEVGSGSHGAQTGLMLERLERVMIEKKPDWVVIYGDTNSTLAGALAAAKLHIPVAHVEAGLRSFNRRMPEEINRVVADCLSSLLFCPTDAAVINLAREGITAGVHKVGDVMYDSVLFSAELVDKTSRIMAKLTLEPKSFYLATVHRAENTDDTDRLKGILAAFEKMDRPIIFPLHPRTRKTLSVGLKKIGAKVRVVDPVSYLDMIVLEKNARLILTDSGGVQKEAYWFGVPCLTLREETEWVELVQGGFNKLVGADTDRILQAVAETEGRGAKNPTAQDPHLYGDGRSAQAIVRILADWHS